MIRLNALEKKFGRLEVLRGISLTFRDQGITAILGPNGSGKTTLIKSILGMVLPNNGSILFNGRDIKGQWAYRDQIDYLPQIARFPDNIRVRELMHMIRDIRGKVPAQQDRLVELFGLGPYWDKRLGDLSGGTRQKVNIVQAFMFDSPVMILDEPTNGLDPVALIHLKDLLREERDKGKQMLITTHIMHFVEEMADELIFLLEGNVIFQGRTADLLHCVHEENLENATAAILRDRKIDRVNGHAFTRVTPAFHLT